MLLEYLYNWWLTYPSEKYMTSSVGMVTFPTEWKVIKTMFQTINQITIELQTTNQITIELQFPSVSCNLSFFLTLKKHRVSEFPVESRPMKNDVSSLCPGTLAPWHPGVHINKPITATAKDNLQKIKNCGVLRNPMMHHSQTD